jgi:ABC-type sugar transport system ATPase subunit
MPNALKRRGSLTIWFDPEMTWAAAPTGTHGRQPDDSGGRETLAFSRFVQRRRSLSMNFLRGTLEQGAVVLPDGSRLATGQIGSGTAGQVVVFGIRPELLALSPDGSGLAAQVEVVEPTGANIQVYARVTGMPICAVFTARHDFLPGQTINLTWPSQKVQLFDKTTGQRV